MSSSLSLESIKEKYKDYLQVLNYYEFEDEIYIGLIKICLEHRRKGYATKILNEICDYADRTNKLITLTPLFYDSSTRIEDIEKTIEDKNISSYNAIFNLEEFYITKFGFIINEYGTKNELKHIKERLYRKPRRRKIL